MYTYNFIYIILKRDYIVYQGEWKPDNSEELEKLEKYRELNYYKEGREGFMTDYNWQRLNSKETETPRKEW